MTDQENPTEIPIVEAIYDGIVEIPGWKSFLDLACGALRAEIAAILIESNSLGYPERLRLFSSGVNALVGDQIDAFSSENIFSDVDSGEISVRSTTLAMSAHENPVLTSSLGFSAALEPGIAFAFGLWRRGAGEPFDEADRSLCRALVPHLKRAMRIFVQYAEAYRERAVYQAVIDSIGIGVALVDAGSNIMATNAIGRKILLGRNGLHIVNGRLTASAPMARVLDQAVRAAAEAQTTAAREHGQPLALDRPGKSSPLTLIIRPGPSVQAVHAPLRRSAIVVMRDPDTRASVSASVVGELFGLTPAESQLATYLAQGSDLEEAARELGIRRNTVRSQLQSIFMKTSVKRQSELVRKILSSVATLSH
jgi:DNA-binding CsgD family transcriptional regulator